MKSILDRVKKLADYQEISITALEREIGASKGVLSRAIKNSTDIQSKWLQNIVENYPSISSEWLLVGSGEMLKSDAESAYSPPSTQRKVSKSDTKKHIAPEPQSGFVTESVTNPSRTTPKSGKNVMSDSCDLCTEKERMIRTLEDMIVQLKEQLGDKDVIIDQYRERCTTLEADIARYTDVSDKETRQAG